MPRPAYESRGVERDALQAHVLRVRLSRYPAIAVSMGRSSPRFVGGFPLENPCLVRSVSGLLAVWPLGARQFQFGGYSKSFKNNGLWKASELRIAQEMYEHIAWMLFRNGCWSILQLMHVLQARHGDAFRERNGRDLTYWDVEAAVFPFFAKSYPLLRRGAHEMLSRWEADLHGDGAYGEDWMRQLLRGLDTLNDSVQYYSRNPAEAGFTGTRASCMKRLAGNEDET